MKYEDSKYIDAILLYLKYEKKGKFINQILDNLSISLSDDKMQYLLSKLINSGYVEVTPFSGGRKILFINDKGIEFINEGGYKKETIFDTLKSLQDVITFVKSFIQ